MRNETLIIRILIWLICGGLIVFNLIDLYNVLWGGAGYSFGSEFHPAYSIYIFREVYIAYIIVYLLALVAMIYFSYKRSWHAFLISLALALILFLYPILSGTP